MKRSARTRRTAAGGVHTPRAETPGLGVYMLNERRKDTVAIERVVDLRTLLDRRSFAPHGDVIDALTALVVELLDEESADDEGENR